MPKLLEEMEQVLNDIRDEDYKLRERGFEVFELLKIWSRESFAALVAEAGIVAEAVPVSNDRPRI